MHVVILAGIVRTLLAARQDRQGKSYESTPVRPLTSYRQVALCGRVFDLS
jgi:hypothetical protein